MSDKPVPSGELIRAMRAAELSAPSLGMVERMTAIYQAVIAAPSEAKSGDTVPPLEPTPAMIEAGAQRLVRWETGKEKWPESWNWIEVRAARQEAERVWRSMWCEAMDSRSEYVQEGASTGDSRRAD